MGKRKSVTFDSFDEKVCLLALPIQMTHIHEKETRYIDILYLIWLCNCILTTSSGKSELGEKIVHGLKSPDCVEFVESSEKCKFFSGCKENSSIW